MNPSIKLVTVPLAWSESIARCSILGLLSLRKQQIGKLPKHIRYVNMNGARRLKVTAVFEHEHSRIYENTTEHPVQRHVPFNSNEGLPFDKNFVNKK